MSQWIEVGLGGCCSQSLVPCGPVIACAQCVFVGDARLGLPNTRLVYATNTRLINLSPASTRKHHAAITNIIS